MHEASEIFGLVYNWCDGEACEAEGTLDDEGICHYIAADGTDLGMFSIPRKFVALYFQTKTWARQLTPMGDHDAKSTAESDKQRQWDYDDIMLFFWANSPAATERLRKKQEEEGRTVEHWRQGLASI